MANIDKKPLDENCLRHGEWIAYHPNNQLYFRGNYVHGIRHGLWEGYYSHGTLMYQGYMNMRRRIGHWHFYGEKHYYLYLI